MKINKKALLIDAIMMPIALVFLFPLYYMIINTMKTMKEMAFAPLAFPEKLYLDNYVKVINSIPIISGFINSLIITSASVILILLFGLMAAYPIVFNKNKLNKFLMIYLLCGFMIPFQAVIVPLSLTMGSLGLIDSIPGMILLKSAGCTFTFFLSMGYMRSIPNTIREAAIVDGCSVFKVFWIIIMPLSTPIIATCAIYSTMQVWNDFIAANIFLHSTKNQTMMLLIYRAKGEFVVDWSLFMTTAFLTLIPIFAFYLIMQKYIIKGLVAGAVKL